MRSFASSYCTHRSAAAKIASRCLRAQSWAFAHFCWYYDGGKYRDVFRGLVRDAVRGKPLDPATVATAFGLADPTDWGRIQEEYDWYWDACISRPHRAAA